MRTSDVVFGLISTDASLISQCLERMASAVEADCPVTRVAGQGWGLGVVPCGSGNGLAESEDGRAHAATAGEIFDTQKVRDRLAASGAIIDDADNASLLLHLYEEAGPEAVMDLNGLFAAAIIQTDDLRAELMVDPIGGIKQLHYATFSTGIAFASHIRQILATGLVNVGPDLGVVAGFFVHGHSLPPKTFFNGINKVAPGTVVSYRDGDVTVRRIHEWQFEVRDDDESEHIARFREALSRAVALRASGADNVGALLSGGLDSSVNVALLAGVLGPGVNTFSVAYPEVRFDESPYARAVAQHWQTDHHELVLDSPEILDELPTMVWHLEEPTMDCSFVPTYALARFARGVTDTVISGDGPDHLLGRHHLTVLARDILTRMPGSSVLARITDVAPRAWDVVRARRKARHLWKMLRSTSRSVADAYLSIYEDVVWGPLSPMRIAALLTPEVLAHRNGVAERGMVTPSLQGLGCMEQIISLDMACNGAFGVFAKVGKMAAAHGLAVREPYLDRRVCATACALPSQLKVHGSPCEQLWSRATKKYVLRRVADGIVPELVISKPKQGFEAPIGVWLRHWLQGRSAHEVLPRLSETWTRSAFVQRLFDEHLSGDRDHGCLLLMLITTELWARIFLGECGRRPTYTWTDYLRG